MGWNPIPSAEEVEQDRIIREQAQALFAATEHRRRMAWQCMSLETMMWWRTIQTCAPGGSAQQTVAKAAQATWRMGGQL